jgi:hypothetical protein
VIARGRRIPVDGIKYFVLLGQGGLLCVYDDGEVDYEDFQK